MENLIAHLSRQQIAKFFLNNAPETQQQCNKKAEAITGTSVVQFRVARLDLRFLGNVKKAYIGFVPCHTDTGKLGDSWIAL